MTKKTSTKQDMPLLSKNLGKLFSPPENLHPGVYQLRKKPRNPITSKPQFYMLNKDNPHVTYNINLNSLEGWTPK